MPPPPDAGPDPVVERLRAVAEAALGRPLAPVEERWLGQAPWLGRRVRERRDALIRQLGAGFSGPSIRQQALRVQGELRSYGAISWLSDRRRGEPFPRSDRRMILYQVFTIDPTPPTSLRWLHDILSANVQ